MKWVGSPFTAGLLYTFNFTQVKVKRLPHRVNIVKIASQSELYILKKLSSLKNAIAKLALL